MAKYDSYVICTSPRSGSTLLCKLLAATGVTGNPESYFHRPSISDWLGYFDLAPEVAVLERDVLDATFQAAIAEGSPETGNLTLRQRCSSRLLTVWCAFLILKGLDGGEQYSTVSQQDAQLFQIVLVQVRKSAEIDTVLHKCLGVFAKPQPFQPFANIMRHNRLIPTWNAAKLNGFGSRDPTVLHCAPNVSLGSWLCGNS